MQTNGLHKIALIIEASGGLEANIAAINAYQNNPWLRPVETPITLEYMPAVRMQPYAEFVESVGDFINRRIFDPAMVEVESQLRYEEIRGGTESEEYKWYPDMLWVVMIEITPMG